MINGTRTVYIYTGDPFQIKNLQNKTPIFGEHKLITFEVTNKKDKY